MSLQGGVTTTSYKKLFQYQKQPIPQKGVADLGDAIDAAEHPCSKGPVPKTQIEDAEVSLRAPLPMGRRC